MSAASPCVQALLHVDIGSARLLLSAHSEGNERNFDVSDAAALLLHFVKSGCRKQHERT